VVARIYDPRRAAIYHRLGIPTVATVAWTTDQVLRRLLPGDHAASWTDSSGQVALVERDLPPSWAGRPLSQLEEPGRWKLVSVTRLGSARIFDSELVGQEGDILHLIVTSGTLGELQERLDATPDAGGHH
jgi:trk system potassium uptake protein TrkA